MKLILKTPAKINLGLHIHHKRRDGYHELETLLQMVSLYDELELELLTSGVELECDTLGIPTDDTNLACRAAHLLQKTCKAGDRGVRIRLKKKFPPVQASVEVVAMPPEYYLGSTGFGI